MEPFDGLACHLGNLSRLSDAQSRSISPENRDGRRGGGGRATEGSGSKAARELGPGWKISPSIIMQPGETETLAEIEGPGAIQHIWITASGNVRWLILRIYWDGQEHPSIECPLGDFFANAYGKYGDLASLAVTTGPFLGMNCYWPMPFRRSCRITLEHIGFEESHVYWSVDYALAPVAEDCAYFHAQFRRSNPLPYMERHTLLDHVSGKGHYVGTYLAWGVHSNEWWGEGEIEFFLDDDEEYPTIIGTGTEDYFGGAWNFDVGGKYQPFSTPYAGMPHVISPESGYKCQQRFGLYRWHIPDPIRFERRLRVRIQALGWRSHGRYLPLQDDISSVAFWYQTLPAAPFPPFPDRNGLEIT